jgi:23S rRNA (pseudouridine1915-N3)-methyltransferase
MKLAVVAVGKLKRLRRYVSCEMIEVRTEKDLQARAPARLARWALDERGTQFSSVEFAKQIEKRMTQGIAFMIGGAEGLPQGIHAEVTLSLGRMTLAHRLARLVLLEQLYRAFTIIRGEPYHRG